MEPRMYSSIAASLSTANAGGGAAAPEDEACRVGPQHWRMKLAAPVDASCSSAAFVARAQLVKAHPHKAHPPMLPGSSWLQALHNAMHVLQQPPALPGNSLLQPLPSALQLNQPALHQVQHPAAAHLRCPGTARR